MRYLHTMVRVADLDESLDFYVQQFGLSKSGAPTTRRAATLSCSLPHPRMRTRPRTRKAPLLELTFNWDPETYTGGRNFGHLAYGSTTSTPPARS